MLIRGIQPGDRDDSDLVQASQGGRASYNYSKRIPTPKDLFRPLWLLTTKGAPNVGTNTRE